MNMASSSQPGVTGQTTMTKSEKRVSESLEDNYSCGDPDLRQCWVCGENSSTYHYGVVACDGCKSFFSRSQSLHKTYQCVGKECVVNKFTRNQCQFCRWVKCQAVGMSKDACKLGRRSKKLKAAMREKSRKLLNLENPTYDESAGQPRQKPLIGQIKSQEVVNVVRPFRIETRESDVLQTPIKVEFSPPESPCEAAVSEEKVLPGQPPCKEEELEQSPCLSEEDNSEGSDEAAESQDGNCAETDFRSEEAPERRETSGGTCAMATDAAPAETGDEEEPPVQAPVHVMKGLTVEELVRWLEQCQYESFILHHFREREKFQKEKSKMIKSKMGKRQLLHKGRSHNPRSPDAPWDAKERVADQTVPFTLGQHSCKVEGLTPSKTWQYVSQTFTVLIEGVVTFAKRLPSFKQFDMEDRMTIIKAGCFEVVLVRLSMLHHLPSNTMTFFGTDMAMTLQDAQKTPMGSFVTGMFDFCGRINSLNLTNSEKALLSAVTLMSADRPGLKSKELVSSMQETFLQALQHELIKNHAEDETLLSQVLLLLPKLREINFEHNKKLMEMKINQDIKFPLLHEEVFETY